MSSIEKKILNALERARKDLLDLSRRNSLINFRPLRAKGIEVIENESLNLFKLLVEEGKTLKFVAKKREEDEEKEQGELWISPPPNQAELNFDNRSLLVNYTSEKMHRRLLKTYRDAKTALEETGVNILYLALGFLSWTESDSSEEVNKAPLLLIPVQLKRSNVTEEFSLSYTGEEIDINLSIKEKILNDFGLEFPDNFNEGIEELKNYFKEVELFSSRKNNWSCNRDTVHLSFFSFSKFLMFKDLDTNFDGALSRLVNHPVLGPILGNGLNHPPLTPLEEEELGNESKLDIVNVKDIDSSQAKVLTQVKKGQTIVVQGPPGTGKSQTITNMISDAVANGKRVLFVSEKMAALEVVKSRLVDVGVGDCAIEIHSGKANKRSFLKELQRTLELGRPNVDNRKLELELLKAKRKELNEYSNQMNEPVAQCGVTPYEAVGQILNLGDGNLLIINDIENWSLAKYDEALRTLELYREFLNSNIEINKNPFYGIRRSAPLSPIEKVNLLSVFEELLKSITSIKDKITEGLPLNIEENSELTLGKLNDYFKLVTFTTEFNVSYFCEVNIVEIFNQKSCFSEELNEFRILKEEYTKFDSELVRGWQDKGYFSDIKVIKSKKDKWWKCLSGEFRKAKKNLINSFRSLEVTEENELIVYFEGLEKVLDRVQNISSSFQSLKTTLNGLWLGIDTDIKLLVEINRFIYEIQERINNDKLPSNSIALLDGRFIEILEFNVEANITFFKENLKSIINFQDTFMYHTNYEPDATQFKNLSIYSMIGLVKFWKNKSVEDLSEIISLNSILNKLSEFNLYLDGAKILNEDTGTSESLIKDFKYTRFFRIWNKAATERPMIRTFNKVEHEERIRFLKDTEPSERENNIQKVLMKHFERLPSGREGMVGVLHREFRKQRAHLPIRKLLESCGEAILRIKPVFMMSPLSISKYLKPGGIEFDLVIFDEASQVRPVEAFGAILRGKQAVIVGDSMQLPPTSFFDGVVSDGDGTDDGMVAADYESILDIFLAQGCRSSMLRWHYRSKHESLIAVSNQEFYESKLIVFPSPHHKKEDLGLKFHHIPESYFDRGNTRTNPLEAKVIAEKVMKHAKETPHITLGVGAFSSAQAQAIVDQIEILRTQDNATEEFFVDEEGKENFFVKNLENIQGDEREVIFVSIGYGKSQDGIFNMNFGPLNNQKGERRLNVLMTRSRSRCEIFCNFKHYDLDLERSQSSGVRVLKKFLNYAENGVLEETISTGKGFDSPFEKSVHDVLVESGHRVTPQVGCAGFFVDLAVVEKDRPGTYLLGIECDGATYHSSRWARDRDRLRQAVLESLGWKIYRIWSTDWFNSKEREKNKLLSFIENLEASKAQFEELPSQEEISEEINIPSRSVPEVSEEVIPKYEVCNLSIKLNGVGLAKVSPTRWRGWIEKIVTKESPVHKDEVLKRIRDGAGVGRAGGATQEQFQKGLAAAARGDVVNWSEEFLWKVGQDKAGIRDRSEAPSSVRQLKYVCNEEIREAIIKIVNRAYAIDSNELIKAVSAMIGFQRLSQENKELIIDQATILSDRSVINREGAIFKAGEL